MKLPPSGLLLTKCNKRYSYSAYIRNTASSPCGWDLFSQDDIEVGNVEDGNRDFRGSIDNAGLEVITQDILDAVEVKLSLSTGSTEYAASIRWL